MRVRLIFIISMLCGFSTTLWAQTVRQGAEPTTIVIGDQDADIWLQTHTINPPFEIHWSGDGIELETAPLLVSGSDFEQDDQHDYVSLQLIVADDATPGLRDLWLEDQDGLRVFRSALMLTHSKTPVDVYRQAIRVDAVSRASPSYARPGEQVNLWLVGRGFEPTSVVSFDREGLEQATLNGQPLPNEVFLRSQGQNNELDGLQFYMQVGGPDQVQPGPVNVTVTNVDGSSATGFGLIEILQPGQTSPPPNTNKPVDAVTGASPRAVFLGRNVSLWIWGEGFVEGAQVEFLSSQNGAPVPGIQTYANPEVVERSTSHPGFAGIRNFLLIDSMAPLGPVDVRVTNPNGSSQTARQLFSLVNAADGAQGSPDYAPEGACPPEGTPIREISSVQPASVIQGETFELVITGYGFACGAAVSISGGGMEQIAPLTLLPGGLNAPSTLRWQLKALENARTGKRDIAVINPDNVSKVSSGALSVQPATSLAARPGCTVIVTKDGGPTLVWLAVGVFLLLSHRRRASETAQSK